MIKSLLLGGALAVFSMSVQAQTRVVDETIKVDDLAAKPVVASLGALLQLQAKQSERLERLSRDLERNDVRSTRAKALKVLSPVQRAQLESLASDPRYQLRADWVHQLLLAPPQNLAPVAAETRAAPRAERSGLKGTGNYGVYGGYYYGRPDVGVYGNYQQGAVGIHGGLGRGGPSIGLSIGRVFGVFR